MGERKGGQERGRRALALIFGALAVIVALLTASAAAAAPLSISVAGNHFVNGEGQTIRLLGVNRSSAEYACVDGYGYDDGHFDDADAAAIASWKANAVRVPLNEDCWLGINGQPNSSQGPPSPLTMAGYRQEIENYVAALNAHGLYAILDLHWTAPGEKVALAQQPMADEDHSVAFWQSVAATFKSNPAVVFDLFNEPFDPTDPRSGEDGNIAHKVSWNCWRDGGCTTDAFNEQGKVTTTYKVAGMQSLVNAVRGTGATQPLLLGGLDYANDLTGWLSHEPVDPLNQLAASFHNYQGKTCENVGCWNSQIAPVAASVPVVTGEFAEDVCTPTNFDNKYMNWADQHGIGYLGWAWIVLTQGEQEAEGCGAFTLIDDYAGTPASPNGVALRNHLLALAGGAPTSTPPGNGSPSTPSKPGPKIKLLRFRDKVLPGGKVSFQLEAAKSCQAVIAGQTVKPFKLDGHKARKVGLGSAKVGLKANKPATVTLKLPAKAAQLLKANGSLKARFTVTLSAGGAPASVLRRVVTLRRPGSRARPAADRQA